MHTNANESSDSNSKCDDLDAAGHCVAWFFWISLRAALTYPVADGTSLLWAKEMYPNQILPLLPTNTS